MSNAYFLPPSGKGFLNTRIGQIRFLSDKFRLFTADRWLLIVFLLFFTRLQAQNYVWPTDASRLITSSFGEYRSNHIHAGLDVKTWGAKGWRAFALDTGSVDRLEVSPYGYGRSLLIQLNNGMKVLYAHLSRFSEPLESIVRMEQKRVCRYGIAMDFKPGFLPVGKGQVVAFTGDTGAGGSHLHFEVWDQDGNAMNPLLLGFPIKDSVPPTLKSVAFTPLGYGSHVEGDFETKIVPLQRIARGFYKLNPTILAWGNVGIELSSFDMADGVSSRFAPYEVKLYVDEKYVFSSCYDRFPQSITRQIHLERDYGLDLAGRGIFQKLYVNVGNTLPFYNPASVGSGELCCWDMASLKFETHWNPTATGNTVSDQCVLEPGEHTIRIEAVDYFGNLAFAVGSLKMVPISEVATVVRFPGRGWSGGIPGKMQPPKADVEEIFSDSYIQFRVQFDGPVAEIPRLFVGLNGWSNTMITLLPKSPKEFIGAMPLDENATGVMTTELRYATETGTEKTAFDTLLVYQVTPEYGGTMVSPDGLCRIVFPPGSVYKPVWGTVRTEPASTKVFGLGTQYAVEPENLPLKDTVQVVFDVGGAYRREQKTGIYGIKKNGGLSYLGNRWENGLLTAWTPTLSKYTVLVDTIAPSVFGISPAPNARLCKRTPLIRIHFTDRLSGVVDEENYEVSLDGIRVVMEYNPKKCSAIHQITEPLATGKHMLEVRVQDRAGNVSTNYREFYIK